MTGKPTAKRGTPPGEGAALRRRAEQRLKARKPGAAPRGDEDARRLVHELEVHQIELEIQNEELRKSRHEAETAAERYAELYEFAPTGYATLGGDGTVRAINLTGATLFGIERKRLVGELLGAFVCPQDRIAFAVFLEEARNADHKSSSEFLLTNGAKRFHARLTAAPLRRPGAEILLALEDVSERKRREQDLEEALRVLNVSQGVAGLGTFVMEVDTLRWTSSPTLDEIVGIDARFGRTAEGWRALVHPDDREEAVAHLRMALRNEQRLDREYRIVRPSSGDVRWMSIQAAIEYGGPGPRLVGTIQDITERRRILQERAELLRIAQEERARAEEANRSKDLFLSTLSHELRNPLAPIANSASILEQAQAGSEQARRAVTVIHRQVSHMSRLVDDLLDVARIARGKIHLERGRVELSDLARSVIEDHRSVFERSEVRIELTPAREPVVVEGDRDRLAQILGNLLQNAAKFSRPGGTTRVIVSEDPGEACAVVRVTDDGIGMDPDMLSRLFQPFMQADTTLDRRKGGLGLGMALAKDLVELHGGRIGARSAGIDQGSEFEVRLPLANASGAALEVAHRRATRSPRRVLIIEDNVDAADTLRELLELHGHRVAVAYDGPEGLARARELRPEIVLCDMGLPGMHGCEVARAIRADPAIKDAYLIALTGYALPEDVQRAAESGFQRHVAKPPDPDELERMFAEVPRASSPVQDAPR